MFVPKKHESGKTQKGQIICSYIPAERKINIFFYKYSIFLPGKNITTNTIKKIGNLIFYVKKKKKIIKY